MSSAELEDRFQAVRDFAVRAGRGTLRYFQSSTLQVDRKSDESPVTVADREAEQQLRGWIAERFPQDGVLGEEFPETPGTSGYRWIVDPIDGTKSFIAGVPLFGTMVAVEHDGQAIIGAVYIPGLDEGIYAGKGKGAWHFRGEAAPTPARVAEHVSLGDAIFVTSEIKTFDRRQARGVYESLERSVFVTRTWGDCYGYLLVATGRAHLMIDPIMNVWDAAAIQPIMEEAGGVFTDWQGTPTIHSGEGIGTVPALLDEILQRTRNAPRLN
ncbi:MAG: histidinol-phosphatase [Pirellulaceae bacterium]